MKVKESRLHKQIKILNNLSLVQQVTNVQLSYQASQSAAVVSSRLHCLSLDDQITQYTISLSVSSYLARQLASTQLPLAFRSRYSRQVANLSRGNYSTFQFCKGQLFQKSSELRCCYCVPSQAIFFSDQLTTGNYYQTQDYLPPATTKLLSTEYSYCTVQVAQTRHHPTNNKHIHDGSVGKQ